MTYIRNNPNGQGTMTNSEPVVIASNQTAIPVSGTITVSNPTTNPETGLAKDGTDITTPTAMPTGGVGIRGWLSAIWTKLNGSLAVTGTFFQATQPVSIAATVTVTGGLTDTQIRATALPVSGTLTVNTITGFALDSTVAKDASLTTLNTSVNTLLKPANTLAAVTTIGTITNPVTVNAGTNLNTSALALDATLTGGTQKSISRGGAKGSTVAGDVTSTNIDANTQGLDVSVKGTVSTTLSGTPSVSVSNFPATQTIAGTVSANATLSAETTKVIGTVNVAGTVPVSGTISTGLVQGLTDTQVRATPLPISGTVTANTGLSQPITDTQIRATALPVSLASTTITNFPATQAVTGTFFQGTQPVSIATSVAVTGPLTDTQLRTTPVPISGTVSTGLTQPLTDTQLRAAALPVSGTVSVSGVATETTLSALNTKVPSGLTVTANRLQVELPAGGTGLTNTELRASAVPVSIATTVAVSGPLTDTQIRATALPVSLASTTITNFPASQAVTGTFFQATQPVSIASTVTVTGALTDTQIRATPLPISGTVSTGLTQPLTDTQIRATALPVSLTSTTITNFPATQAVSGTVSANATLSAETTKVIGTVNVAGTVPVSGTFFQTTQPVSIATMPTTPVTGTFFQATQPVSLATNTPIIAAGTNSIGTVQAPTIAKGTQGTTGFTTQDLKDAGRNQVNYYSLIPVLAGLTDTLQSLTGTKGGVTVTATTTPAVVTTGKRLRITRVGATYISTAVSGYGMVRLRFNTSGVVAITSPIAATLAIGSGAPTTANATSHEELTLEEAWDFTENTGIGISVQGFAAVTAANVGYVLVSLTGYEY